MKFVIVFFLLASADVFADFTGDTAPFSFIAGKISGMKIVKDLPKESGLNKLGVKAGDIVIDVDGNPIINQQASKVAYELANPKKVEVLRDGKKLSLR